jgi:hypothetical protein
MRDPEDQVAHQTERSIVPLEESQLRYLHESLLIEAKPER